MEFDYDILITGGGDLSSEIIYALSLHKGFSIRCAIACRQMEKAERLSLIANTRSRVSGGTVRFAPFQVSWEDTRLPEILHETRPRLIIQLASIQSPWNIRKNWLTLTREYGFGITTIRHTILSARMAIALRDFPLSCKLINGCYPDFVNQIISSMGLPITCGLGNISIVESIIKDAYELGSDDQLQLVGHHYHVSNMIWEHEKRTHWPHMWLNGKQVENLPERLSTYRLPPDKSVNKINAVTVLPLIWGVLGYKNIHLNLGAPDGLPGGYPVYIKNGEILLDLPMQKEEAIAYTKSFEIKEGVTVGEKELTIAEGATEQLRKIDGSFTGTFHYDNLFEEHEAFEKILDRLD